MKRTLLVLTLLTVPLAGADLSGSAAGYLQTGVGARQLGMGGAGVALVDDATANYWNPAGLTKMGLHGTQLASMVSFLTLDRAMNYLALGQHSQEWGDFGASVTHFGVEGIERYDSAGVSQGTFSDTELAFSFSYANTVTYQLRYGVTARGLYHGLAESKAYGYGADLGMLYQPSLARDFQIGFNLQNPVGALQWDTGRQDPLAPNFKLGVSDKYMNARFALAADLDVPLVEGSQPTAHFGAELWLIESLAARAGLNRRDFTAGATWRHDFYEFDYAYTFNSRSLGDSHLISLILLF